MPEIIRDVYSQPQHFIYSLDETKKVWITSDHHFGHANIIKFCDRPFDNVEAMDCALVERWNGKVNKDDTVFHLGDFTLGDDKVYRQYMAQLNGDVFHLGQCFHHDKRWISKPFFFKGIDGDKCIKVVSPIVRLDVVSETVNGATIVLCHYPMASWEKAFHGSYCLHGHTHNTEQFDIPRLINACVDVTDFEPLNLYEFLKSQSWGNRKREKYGNNN